MSMSLVREDYKPQPVPCKVFMVVEFFVAIEAPNDVLVPNKATFDVAVLKAVVCCFTLIFHFCIPEYFFFDFFNLEWLLLLFYRLRLLF